MKTQSIFLNILSTSKYLLNDVAAVRLGIIFCFFVFFYCIQALSQFSDSFGNNVKIKKFFVEKFSFF